MIFAHGRERDRRLLPWDVLVDMRVNRGGKAGSTVILYTDGLVERRGVVIDTGLDRLLEEAGPRRDHPAATLAREIVHALRDPDHSDDICVLVARLAGAD